MTSNGSPMSSDLPSPLKTQKKLRILCADDNSLLADVLQRLFSTAGHEVEHMTDGSEAWDKLSKNISYFDVLITGHHMPGLNGVELVERLRKANYPGRIVVHSSAISDPDRQTYRLLGVKHIVAKTAPAEELLAIVEAVHEA